MSDSIISNDSYNVAKKALDGLAYRQELISNNIANIDTPGYRAQTVNFKNTLKRAIKRAGLMRPVSTHKKHIDIPQNGNTFMATNRTGSTIRADGNDVDIDVELSQMAESGIQFQALADLVNRKLRLLKEIATRR